MRAGGIKSFESSSIKYLKFKTQRKQPELKTGKAVNKDKNNILIA